MVTFAKRYLPLIIFVVVAYLVWTRWLSNKV